MAALLVTLAVMAVMLTVALPSWRQAMQREREAELIFRGEQYARAIGLFQRKFAGAFPPNLNVLYEQKFLRKKYRDPMTGEGEFQVLYQTSAGQPGAPPAGDGAGRGRGGAPPEGPSPSIGSPTPGAPTGTVGAQGGIIGVVSRSDKTSIRLYNGRNTYNQWQFLYTAVTTQGGQNPGAANPGGAGAGGAGAGGRGQSGPGPAGGRGSSSSSPGRGTSFGTSPGTGMGPGSPVPQ
jgi:type II secretory pathway pseudopilin PulG